MKRFDFPLSRVLDLRQQQAGLERARLEGLFKTLNQILAARAALKQELEDARAALRQSPASGNDLQLFSGFERHIHSRCATLDHDTQLLHRQVREQQEKTREADRQVKLLENLRAQRFKEWTYQCDKELEELASDSHRSRMLSERRRAG